MSLILLHLSDLHISARGILKPIEKVVAALRDLSEQIKSAAILISGDIAWEGLTAQYEIAATFIMNLKAEMQRELKIDIKLIVVPGNHDCVFPEDSEVRNLVIDKARSVEGIFESSQMLRECLRVQDGFFRWLASLTETHELDDSHRLCWIEHFDLPNGRRVSALCLNTAWMSTINEEQGRLVFPVSKIPEIKNTDFVFSILHHPFNWFQAKNSRDLRQALQASSDVIITGHEHDPDSYTIIARDGASTEYCEGHLFVNPKSHMDCGFNLLFIDLESSRYQVRHYKWNGTLFESKLPGIESAAFARNKRRASSVQALSQFMSDFLRDPGAQFTHHEKDLELEDIFVTPNIRRLTRKMEAEGMHREVIESDYVINRVFDEKYIYFSGSSQCGRTTLAKVLFRHALERNLTAVLLSGPRLKSPEPKLGNKLFIDEQRMFPFEKIS